MNKSILVFALLIVLSVCFMLEAQDTKEADRINVLKTHIWQLKQCMLNPATWKLDDAEAGHRPGIGITVSEIDSDAAALLGLKKGEGVLIDSIESESAVKAGLAVNDIITRCQSLSGKWYPANLDSISCLYLPGDEACLEIQRSMEKKTVRVPVSCKCGKGASCAFKSPFSDDVPSQISYSDAGGITKASAIRMYMSAVDAWIKDYKAAKPEERRNVDFLKYLNEASRKNGAKDWTDYCTRAAKSMGAEQWTKTVIEMTGMQTEKLKKLTEELAKEAEERARGGDEEKGEDE